MSQFSHPSGQHSAALADAIQAQSRRSLSSTRTFDGMLRVFVNSFGFLERNTGCIPCCVLFSAMSVNELVRWQALQVPGVRHAHDGESV